MPTIQEWNEAALIYGRQTNGWHAISCGTEEYRDGFNYFDRLGFAPWAFRRLQGQPNAKWTAPCQWPQWFDLEAARKPHLRAVPRTALTREAGEALDAQNESGGP